MQSLGASLNFRNDDGPVQGFTNLHADRDKTNDRSVIRELLQNSLDASPDRTCQVRVDLANISLEEIPFIKEYRSAFEASAEYREEHEPATGKQAIQRIKEGLSGECVQCLVCADNGAGIGSTELRSLYGSGASTKGVGSRGSVGHGHLTAFAPSDFRYVLYAGRNQNAEETFGGHAILASHKADQELRSADGFVREFTDGQQRLFDQERGGRKIPTLMRPYIGDDTGSVVMIVGYKPIQEQNGNAVDLILGSTAQHFLVAIHGHRLTLELSRDEGTKHILDGSASLRDAVLAIPDSRVKKNTLRSLKTLEDGTHFKQLNQFPGVQIWFRKHIDKNEGRKARVSVFRDGMWIVDNLPNYLSPASFAKKVPFDAVVNLDSTDTRSFGAFVRDAEGASHQDIRPNELSNKNDQKALRDFLKELQNFLLQEADDIGDQVEDYVPPELMLMGGAVNLVQPKKRLTREPDPGGKRHDDAPTPTPGNGISPTNRGGGQGSGRENVNQRVKPGNNTGIRTSCRPDNQRTGRFHIRWTIAEKTHQSGELGLRLRVPSGTDRTSRNQVSPVYLAIASARIDQSALALDGSRREVRIPIPKGAPINGTVIVDVEDVDQFDRGLVEAEIVHRKRTDHHDNDEVSRT